MSQVNFFDIGTIVGSNSAQTYWPTYLSFIPSNSFFGLTYFYFSSGKIPQFNQQLSSPWNIASSSGYSAILLDYFNFRVRSCLPPNIYYRKADQMCYATCPPYSYLNTTFNFCYGCNYACYNCSDPGVSSCTACDASAYRDLVTGACLCQSGFYDTGVATCSACHYTCLTCEVSAPNCLTCDSTRILTGSACPCAISYYDNATTACLPCDPTCL
jgi:hypothetical protein